MLTPREIVDSALAARDLANARNKVVSDARRAKLKDPGIVRDQFQKTAEQRTLTKKPDEIKRPHCMKRPKRGKGGGAGKGFVPFC